MQWGSRGVGGGGEVYPWMPSGAKGSKRHSCGSTRAEIKSNQGGSAEKCGLADCWWCGRGEAESRGGFAQRWFGTSVRIERRGSADCNRRNAEGRAASNGGENRRGWLLLPRASKRVAGCMRAWLGGCTALARYACTQPAPLDGAVVRPGMPSIEALGGWRDSMSAQQQHVGGQVGGTGALLSLTASWRVGGMQVGTLV